MPPPQPAVAAWAALGSCPPCPFSWAITSCQPGSCLDSFFCVCSLFVSLTREKVDFEKKKRKNTIKQKEKNGKKEELEEEELYCDRCAENVCVDPSEPACWLLPKIGDCKDVQPSISHFQSPKIPRSVFLNFQASPVVGFWSWNIRSGSVVGDFWHRRRVFPIFRKMCIIHIG